MRTIWMVTIGAGVVAGLTATMTASAGAFVNPYLTIVERNPFSLRPPATISEEPPLPPKPIVPLATVEVTGITSILAEPRVLLEIIPGPGKPMIKPILGVGDRVDSIEVVSIDVEKAEVVIRNDTVVTNMTLKVVKAGVASIPPQRGVPPVRGIVPGRPTPIADVLPAVPSDRRAVSIGGGVAVPERLTRVPRLPPVPVNNSTVIRR